MALTEKELEQKHMDDVVAKIKQAEKRHQSEINKVEQDRKDIMDDFKNNVRIKTGSYAGIMETGLTVRQQQQLLQERENSWQHATQRLEVLEKLEKKPYFARIDFTENDGKQESIYIGLGSFADTPDHFMIYDWRAPISSIYYDGKLGEVTYDTPDGPQTAVLTLKRQFMVEDGKIITLFDTDETVGDQMLLEVLDESSDIKMKSIVTTIQKEQNKIIRDTKSDLLFVQGAAGSGKTSAVLQRVAYLLYRYRGNLSSSQVVLFSPNQLFNDYIDQVLPELGEQNMVQMTYYQYSQRRLPKIHVETLQERFDEDNQPLRRKISALKSSLTMFNATTNYSDYLNTAGMRFRDIKYNGEIFFSKKDIKKIYYSFNSNYNLRNRLSATKEKLIKILNSKVGELAKQDNVQKQIQDLSREELNELYGDEPRNFVNGDQELKFLARSYVMKQLRPVQRAIVRNRFLSINKQFVHFMRNIPELVDLSKFDLTLDQWNNDVDMTVNHLKNHKLTIADVTIYLYLYDLITGKRGEVDIKHVFIDEIQDYTAYQLAYLKFGFPRAKFTMLGDLNQAIFTKENSHTLLDELGTMFDKDKTKVIQLTQSYRSTQQITDFTKEVLVNGEKVTSFARKGPLPTITIDNDEEKLINNVVMQLHRNDADKMTTAIIGKSLSECEKLTEKLKNKGAQVTLIKTENQRLVPGTIVVPSFLAKGLEFDAIIMWNASRENYHDENERQLVYTICSRAMHRLDIFAVKELTPLMDRINPELYEMI
ncbi:AAA family ATPase [Ligilactobacillus sp. MP3]|uniref:RNA polymerase recycling motor HelD n=1 Tax=Ligilactobacillus sp. MP3 TaxID=2965103 RepID=UPI0021088BE1|nr:RNA polymerase recycling motor HelD [Ligilactobacillus sp. MP3]MCQ4116832.1 AAA family ATPase [Ligilactobacillus sp. MP3]